MYVISSGIAKAGPYCRGTKISWGRRCRLTNDKGRGRHLSGIGINGGGGGCGDSGKGRGRQGCSGGVGVVDMVPSGVFER